VLGNFPLPVEVIPMAQSYVAREIVKLGGQPILRDGFTTDNGNIILDIENLSIMQPFYVMEGMMTTEQEQKLKIIEDAISSIEKTYGKGSIMKLGDGVIHDIEAIPTGALSLDYALGIGGIPRGRVTEVYGPESSGKTTLCLHVIAEAQKTGGLAAFIDAEHALDVNYAKKLGVDTANLLVSQPDFGEQALEITDTLVRSNAIDIIVIDSVAALVPRSEIEGEMGDATMAVQARLMSQALRK